MLSVQRLFDLGVGLLLLVILSPLLAGIAVLIASLDGRPIFFSQVRVGREGRRFRLYKFRTLETGPKDPTRPAQHETRLGGFLRRYALDELPQLWNVLRGDMSLVGPRPALPDQVERYGTYERERLRVRPGLTGWAQIHGRNALSWPERIDCDVWYVRHRSLVLDLRILFRTPALLLRGDGVYGADGQNPSFIGNKPPTDDHTAASSAPSSIHRSDPDARH
jgi:lipopolysaccharide/colanic/teichoic acid biosynthesis glycosyltransferase